MSINNKTIFVKVIGKVPPVDAGNEIILKLSRPRALAFGVEQYHFVLGYFFLSRFLLHLHISSAGTRVVPRTSKTYLPCELLAGTARQISRL